jgi:hypothetical protein
LKLPYKVCGDKFPTKSNRIKHERFSKSCWGKVPPKEEKLMMETPQGEKVTIVMVSEEEVKITVDKKSDEHNTLACQYCQHTFIKESNIRAHHCLLEPDVNPSIKVLTLLDASKVKEFQEDHQGNSHYQVYRTCSSLDIAVPGLFPYIFPGPRVVGLGAKQLRPRLEELGCVGKPAYRSLQEAAREGEVLLQEHLSIVLPEGGMVILGPELTVPTSSHFTKGL